MCQCSCQTTKAIIFGPLRTPVMEAHWYEFAKWAQAAEDSGVVAPGRGWDSNVESVVDDDGRLVSSVVTTQITENNFWLWYVRVQEPAQRARSTDRNRSQQSGEADPDLASIGVVA